jgi:Ca2+-binding RTX toxin-like protein
VIAANQFQIGSTASSSDQRFIYDAGTGALFYDSDGTGSAAQVQFAQLSPGLALNHSNIVVG